MIFYRLISNVPNVKLLISVSLENSAFSIREDGLPVDFNHFFLEFQMSSIN